MTGSSEGVHTTSAHLLQTSIQSFDKKGLTSCQIQSFDKKESNFESRKKRKGTVLNKSLIISDTGALLTLIVWL